MTDFRTDPRARGLGSALLRLPLAILLWLIVTAIWLPLFVIGLILVPLQARAKAYEYHRWPQYRRTVLSWRSWWMWPYQNPEDGIDGLRGHMAHDFVLDPALPQSWWWQRRKRDGQAKRIWKWSGLRNPVNAFRFIPKLADFAFNSERLRWFANCEDASQALLDRRTVEALGQPFRPRLFYLFCWHGPLYAQLWVIVTLTRAHHLRWRVGSKACMPRFHAGIPAEHYLRASESFTPLQFSPWRKG